MRSGSPDRRRLEGVRTGSGAVDDVETAYRRFRWSVSLPRVHFLGGRSGNGDGHRRHAGSGRDIVSALGLVAVLFFGSNTVRRGGLFLIVDPAELFRIAFFSEFVIYLNPGVPLIISVDS